jgi:protein-tyrosine phosphatase
MGFVDLHSHVLPGLDDGARKLSDSLEMLALLGQVGFEIVHATPHQKMGSWVPTREAIEGAHAEVSAALPAGSPALRLGAENMWDELFLERSLTVGAVPGYRAPEDPADQGRRAFLFELPVHILPLKVEERLFAVRRQGPLPVMAHPERYTGLWDHPERYETLAQRAALVVDLGALDGAHGNRQGKIARWLCEEGLAHGAASDAHQPSDVKVAAAGIAWIRKRLGDAAVTRLLSAGPRQILNGELPS